MVARQHAILLGLREGCTLDEAKPLEGVKSVTSSVGKRISQVCRPHLDAAVPRNYPPCVAERLIYHVSFDAYSNLVSQATMRGRIEEH